VKAALLVEFNAPLDVRDVPEPQPGPHDAVVRVEACGVCRSDWHVWRGDWAWVGVRPKLPRVLGHEFAGVVEAVGEAVELYRPGDRVTTPFRVACGRCELCKSGRSNLCAQRGVLGVDLDGAFARWVRVPAADTNLVRLPDGVDFVTAASLGCRYTTAYHAVVNRAALRPGEWVAVFGAGAVGLSAVQVASAVGGRVVAVDVRAAALHRALEEGAEAVVDAGSEDPVRRVRELTDGQGAHVAVEALGLAQTAEQAVRSVRRGGRVVQVGLTGREDQGRVSLPLDRMVLLELSWLGSAGCPGWGFPGLLGLVASGRLNPRRLVAQTVALEEVNRVLEAMSAFETSGFCVVARW